MKYGDIKSNSLDIKRYISFRIIEEVVVHNKGELFKEFVRFHGSQLFVQWNNRDDIKLVNDEDDASVFSNEEEAQVVYLYLIDKLKSGEIKGEGVQVIEYNELHNRSSEVLQYPNKHYTDFIQPILTDTSNKKICLPQNKKVYFLLYYIVNTNIIYYANYKNRRRRSRYPL